MDPDRDRPTILRLTTEFLRQQHSSNRWVEFLAQVYQQRVVIERVVTGSRTDEGIRWMLTEVVATNARTARAEQLNNIRTVAPTFLALRRFPRLVRE